MRQENALLIRFAASAATVAAVTTYALFSEVQLVQAALIGGILAGWGAFVYNGFKQSAAQERMITRHIAAAVRPRADLQRALTETI